MARFGYAPHLREFARKNRAKMPIGEAMMWGSIRRKQIRGVRFLRQYPIERYIVDFFAPEISLAVEIDGSTHDYRGAKDAARDSRLLRIGVRVLRFTEGEVRNDHRAVVDWIERVVESMQSQAD